LLQKVNLFRPPIHLLVPIIHLRMIKRTAARCIPRWHLVASLKVQLARTDLQLLEFTHWVHFPRAGNLYRIVQQVQGHQLDLWIRTCNRALRWQGGEKWKHPKLAFKAFFSN